MKIENFILFLLTLPLILAGCSNDDLDSLTSQTDMPVQFSAYTASTKSGVTRATSVSTDVFNAEGIGVFAFYQKAKSNGYPVDFNKYTGEPTFMYNQQVKPTLITPAVYYTQEEIDAAKAIITAATYISGSNTEAETVAAKKTTDIKTPAVYGDWDYTPHKYWSNNENDQFSFFAYAPYDETYDWTFDYALEANLKGTIFKKKYIVEDDVADQTDFLWADPILNMQKPTDTSEKLQFNFRHLCSRLTASAKVNVKTNSVYVTVDEVKITGDFVTSGTMTYTLPDKSSQWILDDSEGEKNYYPFQSYYELDEDGNRVFNTFTVSTDETQIGEPVFVFPGKQEITLTALVSQRSSTTDYVKTYTITKTFDADDMNLKEGMAYNFLLNITLTPITFTGQVTAEWSSSITNFTSPDNGTSWK